MYLAIEFKVENFIKFSLIFLGFFCGLRYFTRFLSDFWWFFKVLPESIDRSRPVHWICQRCPRPRCPKCFKMGLFHSFIFTNLILLIFWAFPLNFPSLKPSQILSLTSISFKTLKSHPLPSNFLKTLKSPIF